MFLIQKYTQYKAAQAEQQKRKVTEKELTTLNHKIDKLLTKLDEHEPELANHQDEECVVCVHAKATMQTYPCGHRVVCRKCFVKTIQMAVAQRMLPLRCVMCRAKILRLKHTVPGSVHSSASQYTLGSGQWYHVPQSASLYSVTSSTSGVSGVSSASSCNSASSYKTCSSGFSASSKSKHSYSSYSSMGYQPLRTSSPPPLRSPCHRSPIITPNSDRPSGAKLISRKDNKICPVLDTPTNSMAHSQNPKGDKDLPKGKLTLIREFQREYRQGKEQSQNEKKFTGGNAICGTAYKPGSTRIKCARHLVNQAQRDIPSPSAPGPSQKAGERQPTSSQNSMKKSDSLNETTFTSKNGETSVQRSMSMHEGSKALLEKTDCRGASAVGSPKTCPEQDSFENLASLRLPLKEASIGAAALDRTKPTMTGSGVKHLDKHRKPHTASGMSGGSEILSASGLTFRFGGSGSACGDKLGIGQLVKSRTPSEKVGCAGVPLLEN